MTIEAIFWWTLHAKSRFELSRGHLELFVFVFKLLRNRKQGTQITYLQDNTISLLLSQKVKRGSQIAFPNGVPC